MINPEPVPTVAHSISPPAEGPHVNPARVGKLGWMLLWLLGIPLPLLLIVYALMA
jgi:hypothetical protein